MPICRRQTMPAAPQAEPGKEVIVSLSAPGPIDDPLWEALARLDVPVRVVAPVLTEPLRHTLSRPNITLDLGMSALLKPADFAARCRVLVSQGDNDIVSLGARAALPQVCLPQTGKQALNGFALGKRGVAVVLDRSRRNASDILVAIRETYQQLRRVGARPISCGRSRTGFPHRCRRGHRRSDRGLGGFARRDRCRPQNAKRHQRRSAHLRNRRFPPRA